MSQSQQREIEVLCDKYSGFILVMEWKFQFRFAPCVRHSFMLSAQVFDIGAVEVEFQGRVIFERRLQDEDPNVICGKRGVHVSVKIRLHVVIQMESTILPMLRIVDVIKGSCRVFMSGEGGITR